MKIFYSFPVRFMQTGKQGIQGIQGQILRKRGYFTSTTLTSTSEEIYFNENVCDYIIYPDGGVDGGTRRMYRLNKNYDIVEWTKDGYYTSEAPSTLVAFDTSHPRLPSGNGTDNGTWVVFNSQQDTAFNFLISNAFASETANIVEAFIGEGGTANEDGSISLANGANGWAIKAGKIWHTLTGVSLNADGTISDPDGLSLKVGGKNLVATGNLCPFGDLNNEGLYNASYGSYVDSYSSVSPLGSKIFVFGGASSDLSYVTINTTPRMRLKPNTTYTFAVWAQMLVLGVNSDQTFNTTKYLYNAETGGERTYTTDSNQVLYYNRGLQKLSWTVTTDDSHLWLELGMLFMSFPANRVIGFLGAMLVEGSAAPTEYELPSTVNNYDSRLLAAGIDITDKKIRLLANQLECLNLEGDKTAWLNEIGDFTVAGSINSLKKTIDTVEKWAQTFVPVLSGSSSINHELYQYNSNDTETAEQKGLYDEEFAIGINSASEKTVVGVSPLSNSEEWAKNGTWSGGSCAYAVSLDMRAASGIIEITTPLAYWGGSAVSGNTIVVYMPVFNTGYNAFANFLRTPTRMSTDELHFLDYVDLKSLVGRKVTIQNNSSMYVMIVNELSSIAADGYILLQPKEAMTFEFGIYEGSTYSRTVPGTSTSYIAKYSYYYWKAIRDYVLYDLKESELDDDNFGVGGSFY